MADSRIAYGLAKKHGIDAKGMSPKEVWDALKGKGITPDSAEQSIRAEEQTKREELAKKFDDELPISQTKSKEFQDVKSARQFFKDIASEWEGSLSENEKKGITEYTDWRSYNINEDLRNGKYAISKYKNQIDGIDNAISKFSLPQKIKVYRGTNILEFGKAFNDFSDIKTLEGKTISLPSFTSTSTNYEIADKEFNGEVFLKIDIEKGKGKGAYVDYLTYMNPDDEEARESEFLLKRNSKLKIKKVSQREDGKIIVEAEG